MEVWCELETKRSEETAQAIQEESIIKKPFRQRKNKTKLSFSICSLMFLSWAARDKYLQAVTASSACRKLPRRRVGGGVAVAGGLSPAVHCAVGPTRPTHSHRDAKANGIMELVAELNWSVPATETILFPLLPTLQALFKLCGGQPCLPS